MRGSFDISNITYLLHQDFANAAHEMAQAGREQQRPFVLLRPKLSIDGNKWCALYGENLQDGVAGFGDTPEQAAIDFDLNWLNAKP